MKISPGWFRCFCVVLCSFLWGPAWAEPETLADLSRLQEEWRQSREALDAYHVEMVSASGEWESGPHRTDIYIRLDNALYHGFHHANRPGQITEYVTLLENGERVTLGSESIRVEPGESLLPARDLGRLFDNSVERATFLQSPPRDPHWQVMLHKRDGATDRYTVDPETGIVLERIARDEAGQITYQESRTLKPVNVEAAHQKMEALISQALVNEDQRFKEADAAQSRNQFAQFSSILLILLVQAGAGWMLARFRYPGSRYRWISMTLGLIGLVLLAYPLMELALGGYYSMLLAWVVDIPVFRLGLVPDVLEARVFLSTLAHGLTFTLIFALAAWAVMAVSKAASRS